jgi:two-component system, NarL family, nitrate/nitrite response regulator NarL
MSHSGPALRVHPRLLIVDDDVIALRTLERDLAGEGFEVHTAKTIVEAKRSIDELDLDAVLIGTPGGEELRAGSNTYAALIIEKPIDVDRMLTSLRAALVGTRRRFEVVSEESDLGKLLNDRWTPPLPTLGLMCLDTAADAIAQHGQLTDRERDVLKWMLRGDQNPDVARATGMTVRGVKYHVSNILQKLRVKTRGELSRFLF